MATTTATVRIASGEHDEHAVEGLLRSLPGWFGIESAIVHYLDAAAEMPCYLARSSDGAVIGFVLVAHHFPESAEIYLMAVALGWHRQGVGTKLLAAVESDLTAGGVELLQVKTVGPSRISESYAKTRAFYAARGFCPVEELHDLWEGIPCLLLVKPLRNA